MNVKETREKHSIFVKVFICLPSYKMRFCTLAPPHEKWRWSPREIFVAERENQYSRKSVQVNTSQYPRLLEKTFLVMCNKTFIQHILALV